MNEISGFHHVGITVASMERSVHFYRDLLGFEVVLAWSPSGDYIGTLVGYPSVELSATILSLPGTDGRLELLEYGNIDATPIDSRNGNAGTAHIAFYVDKVDVIFERLVAAGVESVSDPVTPTVGPNKGGRVVYLIDPDGVRVELIETAGSFDDFAAACC